jgi:hypothetical protein
MAIIFDMDFYMKQRIYFLYIFGYCNKQRFIVTALAFRGASFREKNIG